MMHNHSGVAKAGARPTGGALAMLFALVVLFAAALAPPASAVTKAEVDAKADTALADLFRSIPESKKIAEAAKGVLIFPEIYKAGLLVGGAVGSGVLRVDGKVDSYYTSVAASFGLQAGVARFGYILFLMDQDSVDYVKRTDGWELGVGPTLVAGDAAFAKKFTTTTLESGVVYFFVNEKGAFAGAGIEGTKITQGLTGD
ncbi:MAG: lipid-binding SYLF domain-containing protein [Alphaproteobacteria bacterium]|nr:lipid-binding SYLF domain-containing protein [Alphaproteobacteria bacterium]MCB9928787.1 lipid-binding SYLF domain-containing protein [Alphaproteobacteria bacterium]